MASQPYQLVMRTGPAPGKMFSLDKIEIYVGRDVNNDVVINDAEVSRRHARLTMQAGGYTIEDLGSTNGTFVNGQRLTRPQLLRPGDTILFGENISLSFEYTAYDPNATVVSQGAFAPPPPPSVTTPPPPSMPQPVQPVRETYVPPTPAPPVQPAYVPPAPAPPPQPAYVGRVPPGPAEPVLPQEPKKRRTGLWVACGCLVVLLCALVGVGLWYVDTYQSYLYCQPPLRTITELISTCPTP